MQFKRLIFLSWRKQDVSDTSAWNSLTGSPKIYKVLNKKFSICWSTSSVPVAQLWSPQHLQPQANILPQSYLAYYAWPHIVTSLQLCQFTEKDPFLFLQNSSYSKMPFGSVGGTRKFLQIGSSIFPKFLSGKVSHNIKTGMTPTSSPAHQSYSLCFFLLLIKEIFNQPILPWLLRMQMSW